MKFHSRWVTTVLLMTALGVSAAVDAAPLAISTTSTGCGLLATDNQTTIGPLTVSGQDSCDFSGSNQWGFYVVSSDVLTGFGPALPKVGVIEAAAYADATGTDEDGVGSFVGGAAAAGGSVTFYFTVEEIRTPPMTYVPRIYFEASGSATIEGFATNNADFNYEGSADAFAILPDGTEWGIEGEISDPESSSWSDEFAQSINLDLAPNDLDNPFYEVTIAAGCDVGAWTGGEFTSRAECHAAVDPTIRFGQEAFDAQYGSDSFPLSEYYTLVFSENVVVPPTTPVDLSGTIKTSNGNDICAMVLASGQHMFSCNPWGEFSLTDLPRRNDGTVKRQIYAHGFFPKIDVLTGSSIDEAVVMTRSGTCPNYNVPSDPGFFPDSAGKWIDISGNVLLKNTQTPVCAMVLANGQHMFSCDGTGSYDLRIPLDSNGQYKLQVYADGFAPTIQRFDEFSTDNTVRMARAIECQAP